MHFSGRFKIVLRQLIDSKGLDLDALKDLSEAERELLVTLYRDGLANEALDLLNDLDVQLEWNQFKKAIVTVKKPAVVPLWKKAMRYAAIFIGLFFMGYFIWIEQRKVEVKEISETSIRLKTGEDAIRVIDEGGEQQIVSVSGKVVATQTGNRISYASNADVHELIYNELEIPYGKVFDIELSDGTLVHLNSGTRIRYPIKFLNGQKREVFIDGEAYFKVSEDKEHPFIVNADAVAVEVLGTEFNISSYREDLDIRTVLVEGSVRLSNSLIPDNNVVLKPGDMGSWDKADHAIKIEEVDVSNYTGWVEGELVFSNSNFENMSKKLERKYNISIDNNNLLLANKVFTAHFNVEIESIEDVLGSINEIHPFSYRISNGKVEID